LRHTLYVEVSSFSQPLEGGFGEQLLRKVYPPLAGVARSAGGGLKSNRVHCHPEEAEG